MAEPVEPVPEKPPPERARHRRTGATASDAEPPRLAARSVYSRCVGTLKIVLPALAVAIVLLVLAWPSLVPEDSRFRIGLSDLTPEATDELSMVNPLFQGRDNQDRPFSIVAEKARRAPDGKQHITLEQPQADITLADGAWVALSADTGAYDRRAKTLVLRGNVSLFHDQGFEMHTSRAQIDLAEGSARSDSVVEGHGPAGTLSAQGFQVRDQGQTIVFTGNSRLIVRGQDAEDSS